MAGGFGYEGSHSETKGLSADGRVIRVPLHRHEVSLDYWRAEIEAEYTFARSWDLVFRLPLDYKDQSSAVRTVDPATPAERESMLRNMEIHHRNESYKGPGDVTLMLSHRRYGLFRDGDYLKLSAGATLPSGRTEENPYVLGRAGLRHLHIQFGTGTVDPYLEAYYRIPLTSRLALGSYFFGRFPAYENGKSFHGAAEVTTGMNLSYALGPRWMVHGNGTWFRQGYAYWGAERDINTGLTAASGLFGATFRPRERMSIGMDLRFPVTQSTLSPDGDTFKHGLTVLLRISKSFP